MSIGTIWLAANLLLNADFKSYWENWKKQPVFWFIAGILLLHVVGLFYSTDLGYAFRDLKTKLPLFVVPITLIGYPILKRDIHLVLLGFLASLLITSIINWLHMSSISDAGEIVSFRDVSLFGSHIRYGLLIVMGIITAVYFFINQPKFFFIWVPVILWLIYYTAIGQVLGGYLALVFAVIAMVLYGIRKFKSRTTKQISIGVVVLLVVLGVFSTVKYFSPNNENYDFGDLPKYTEQGNEYFHDTTFLWFENGNHVMSYISEVELQEAWQNRSELPYHTVDSNGYELKSVIFRYMTSKGLTKDAEGMRKMTAKDIKNIEMGVTNIGDQSNSPFSRFETLKNQIQNYSDGGDPDGNSLLQRFEHWKAAKDIIEENWLVGVGTGDVQAAFDESYRENNSKLDPKRWNRAHNQFLTFWVSFGILGFLLFVIFWSYLLYLFYTKVNFIGLCFTLVAIVSFLSEDTIETQQGVTFIALFLGLAFGLNRNNFSNELTKV
jgi:hypothetical protein